MKRRTTAWLLGALLAVTGTAWAQQQPAAEEKKEGGHGTVTKEEVKTWTAEIDGKEYEVHPATPTYGGDTGLFHLSSAYTLPKGKVSFSLFRDNLDRDPKDLDISIHGLSLGFGATSRLELFGNIGLQHRIDADALFQPGFFNDYPLVRTGWETGVGDVRLGAKYKFLDDYLGDAVGLALRGVVKLPTADEEKGLGTGKLSGGADLILSKHINYGIDLHGSVGYEFNSDPDDVAIGNALKWGAGLNFPSCRFVQLQAEVVGRIYSDDDAFEQTNPVDLVVGPVVWIKPGIFIRPALSWNLNFNDRGLDSSSKSYTGRHLSIGYHPGTACREVFTPPPPPPPPPSNRPPTVACQPEKSEITAGETVRCRATASDPDGDSLTYTWSASAGSIRGSGAEVTFDSAGVSAPATITVTVRVSDGRGGTAEATCTIRVDRKVAEPVTCTSGGFPRNLARLNNVDKACLDDVASRLRQDPRGRVIIVGHADSRERYPEVIARRRGEAVKDYLVKERGIEESRITVRSAAATKPLDTGTSAAARAKNRRVEVIFVPEGATAPEDDD
jgi:outer membrane protein OmpA-like peptidoglycan-associated protein